MIRSSSRDVQQLVADLRQGTPVGREAAIARLRVLGARAVPRLAILIREDASAAARAAGLRTLEGLDDPRAADIAILALADADETVRLAAIATLRGWVVEEDGARVMDALTVLALDRSQSAAVHAAAREALSQLPADIVTPLLARAEPAGAGPPAADDPRALQEWVAAHADAPLTSLHDLVARAREREQAEPRARWKQEWLAARGAVHAALARRDSRVALYDLREAFDSAARPLPADFLTAAAQIGDAACLESMARAWSQATDAAWRTRLSQTAGALVKRLALRARNPTLKRVRRKWPGFV